MGVVKGHGGTRVQNLAPSSWNLWWLCGLVGFQTFITREYLDHIASTGIVFGDIFDGGIANRSTTRSKLGPGNSEFT